MIGFGKKTKRCPYCSEEILESAIKCRYCGSYVDDNKSNFDPHTFISVALSSKYKIISEIGRGGMSTVYKAAEFEQGKIVALKVIHPNLLHDKELLDRFHREAKISSELNHNNIIKVYGDGIENGIHYMSMELLEGKDLHKKIKENGRLNLDEFFKIFIPISYALDYVHSKNLVHRDVKSGNIFITNEGRSVLMDFGIAHMNNSGQLTISGTILGTPEFMSPEQAEGKEIDSTSDIYSLGVVMYQSLTGSLPYTSENPLITISKILNEEYIPVRVLNPDIPENIEMIINRCLSKDRKNRLQSAKELIFLLTDNNTFYKYQEFIDEQKTIKISPENKFNYVTIENNIKETNVSFPEQKESYIITHKSRKKNFMYIAVISGIVLLAISGIISYNNSKFPQKNIDTKQNNQLGIKLDNDNEKVSEEVIKGNNNNFIGNSKNSEPMTNINKNNIDIPVQQTNRPIDEVTQIEVPDLIGAHIDAAKRIIQISKFRVGTIEKIPNPVNVDIVLRQIPKPGTKANKGASINLIIGGE